jgi:SAM-dependent methyltransferase
MANIVYDLKDFYSKRGGRLVRRLISGHIKEIWPNTNHLRVMGHGYAIPYLRSYLSESELIFNLMPHYMGIHHWPDGKDNLCCLCEDELFPIESESIDRMIMVHSLEHAKNVDVLFQEVWRVLKSSGRVIIIVPNRLGMWARADWTPFGHGRPYSGSQILKYLSEHHFLHESSQFGLFMPPFKSFLVLRTAYMFEGFGRYIFPGLAGIHIIEASKQLYAGHPKGKALKSRLKDTILVPKPAVNVQKL